MVIDQGCTKVGVSGQFGQATHLGTRHFLVCVANGHFPIGIGNDRVIIIIVVTASTQVALRTDKGWIFLLASTIIFGVNGQVVGERCTCFIGKVKGRSVVQILARLIVKRRQ